LRFNSGLINLFLIDLLFWKYLENFKAVSNSITVTIFIKLIHLQFRKKKKFILNFLMNLFSINGISNSIFRRYSEIYEVSFVCLKISFMTGPSYHDTLNEQASSLSMKSWKKKWQILRILGTRDCLFSIKSLTNI